MTNTYKTLSTLTLGGESIGYYSLTALAEQFPGVTRLPYSLKILLENLLRREDGAFVKADDIRALATWTPGASADNEISFMPARVLLQDFTGVPCVVDLAAMRDGIIALGGDPEKVNPLQPVELVIDHSVQVDHFGSADAFQLNGTSSTTAIANATCSCAGARPRFATSAWSRRRPESSTRSTSSTSRALSAASRRAAGRWRIPTPSSAPTRTPRW